ncbi:MAG: response regulator transcription factor [Candidatus Izemoplasmataceae bacterium]
MIKKILVVDDNSLIRQSIRLSLIQYGYEVKAVESANEALLAFDNDDYDLIILDLILPDLNGESILKTIRQKSNVLVIILSSKESDIDIVTTLELGADDYLRKPVSIMELIARIQAVSRRSRMPVKSSNQIVNGPLKLDLDNYKLYKRNKEIALTKKEFFILKLLISNPNKVYTKEELFNTVWQEAFLHADNIINVHIRRLREKIEDYPDKPRFIITVWGIGYRFGNVIEL